MKTLFRKDVRENFKLSLIGLAIFTLLLVISWHSSMESLRQILNGQSSDTGKLQPLLSELFFMEANFFCAIFGVMLGWLQTRNEAHRDLWAFLVHRPITRTEIFWGKALAGLFLYFLGAGIPLLGMILWTWLPGHVAVPFEWAMALPATAIFLSGIAYYFAGLLTGLRQARWFASRAFGVGAALATSLAVAVASEFWQTLLATLLLAMILATAAWGAYQSSGYYQGQPRFAKAALAISLAFGNFAVLTLLAGLMTTIFFQVDSFSWRNYRLTMDGEILIMASRSGQETLTDLAGKPASDPKTGRILELHRFNEHTVAMTSVDALSHERNPYWDKYNNATKFFVLWNISSKNLWFVDRHGKLTGFNGITHQHVGNLIPRTASADDAFIRSAYWNSYYGSYNRPHILATSTTVYHVDFEDRKLTPLFQTTPADPILGFNETLGSNTVVLRPSTIQIIDSAGKTLVSVPYQPEYKSYPRIETTILASTNRYAAVLFYPPYWSDLPIHATWISKDGRIIQTLDLPSLREQAAHHESIASRIMNCFIPPVFYFDFVNHRFKLQHPFSFIPSGFCALIAWCFMRRYNFTAGATTAWLLFIFLFGIPALLTFFCVQEWPKRELCPHCKKPRAVDRENCEHCAAAFAPPENIGIEIFEPLQAKPDSAF